MVKHHDGRVIKNRDPEKSVSLKPAARFKKYLLAPVLIGAVAMAAGSFARAKDPYLQYLDEKGVRLADIKKSFTTGSCQYFIVGKESDALTRLDKGNEAYTGVTTGPVTGSDGRLRFVVVVNEKIADRREILENNDLARGITRTTREALASAAATGNPEAVISAMKETMHSAIIAGSDLDKLYAWIKDSAGLATANNLLFRSMVMLAVLDYANTRISDFGKDTFIDCLTHETMHCSIGSFATERKLRKVNRLENEFLAYTGAVAYEGNPWAGLILILWYAKYKYLDDSTKIYEIPMGDPSVGISKEQGEAYKRLFYGIYAGIALKLNISNPLGFIGKTDDQIRKAAKEILDENSRRILGTGFSGVLNVEDLAKLDGAAADYLRNRTIE